MAKRKPYYRDEYVRSRKMFLVRGYGRKGREKKPAPPLADADHVLVEQWKGVALSELRRTYNRKVVAEYRSIDDARQQAIVGLIQALRRRDLTMEVPRWVNYLKSWVRRCLQDGLLDDREGFSRKQITASVLLRSECVDSSCDMGSEPLMEPEVVDDPSSVVVADEIRASLTDRQRQAIDLYLDGHTIGSVSRTLGVSKFAVQEILRRAQVRLRRLGVCA